VKRWGHTEGLKHVGEGVVVGSKDSGTTASCREDPSQVPPLYGLHQKVQPRRVLRSRQKGRLAALRAHKHPHISSVTACQQVLSALKVDSFCFEKLLAMQPQLQKFKMQQCPLNAQTVTSKYNQHLVFSESVLASTLAFKTSGGSTNHRGTCTLREDKRPHRVSDLANALGGSGRSTVAG